MPQAVCELAELLLRHHHQRLGVEIRGDLPVLDLHRELVPSIEIDVGKLDAAELWAAVPGAILAGIASHVVFAQHVAAFRDRAGYLLDT